ncbi:MAG: DUF928 domain-containing protein [Cyanobacteria bacterium J06649_4]
MLACALVGLAGFTEISSVRYTPPPDRGTPRSERGTGSRGDCLYQANLPPMAALVGEPHLLLTVSDRPTLWAYLPYTTADVSHAEIIFQSDSSDQEIYRGFFPLSATPGITGIRLPAAAPALAVDETYRWYIDIPCSSVSSDSAPATLTGVAKRVATSPELTQALEASSTPTEAIAAYGEHHIWYELLSTLAEYRLSAETEAQQPEQTVFEQLWIDMLRDEAGADLGEYAEVPLLGIVMVEAIATSSQLK